MEEQNASRVTRTAQARNQVFRQSSSAPRMRLMPSLDRLSGCYAMGTAAGEADGSAGEAAARESLLDNGAERRARLP
jgi:hypothetical protein